MSFSPCAVGTRKYLAPDCSTSDAFDDRPPIAPTSELMLIVPVAAMRLPPRRSPRDSWSISVSVNANPADGPPMDVVSMEIFTFSGRLTVAVSLGMKPMIVRSGSSGAAIRLICPVAGLPSRS